LTRRISVSAAPLFPYEVTPDAPRKRFTRQEVDQLLDLGIFDGQRFELIDGELFDKMGQKPPHAATIRALTRLLSLTFGPEVMQIQLPIEAGPADRERSVPEPDLAILQRVNPEHSRRHPRGDELALVVEVADSSAAFDLSRKAALYANAGVPEYWVVDLKRRTVVRQWDAREGSYRMAQSFAAGESVPVAGRSIAVADILPANE
jgi:Uma2 family endonuclease